MGHSKKKKIVKKTVKEILQERKKLKKKLLKEKRARLIVKNLPFKATEANVKEYFEKYGEVTKVELLKKPDGKLVGCGFIQFSLVQKAAKAKHHTNGKPFLGREIQVDFAVPKDKYKKKNEVKEETKQEANDNKDIIEIKEEPVDDLKNESEEDVDIKNDSSESDRNSDSEESIGEEEDEDDEVSDEKLDRQNDETEGKSQQRYKSHDVSEGKTIFVKNLPFTATNDDLKKCMIQFGPVYYALVCVDKYTEHSKGTGFVKFRNSEDAEKALTAGTELTLLGNILDCHPAIDKDELKNKSDKNKSVQKDSRNLYLVKEGVILAGSEAAKGVSAGDMAKRLQLEQYKTQMLRNLNKFVSRDRLVIHNLPETWDDKKLKQLVEKYGGKDAYVREARIMRDVRNIQADGLGKSKGFGFVTFTKHENALHCLRALNNNPNIFSPHKRPIVTFSIENRNALKIKQKRLQKSRQKNPLSKDYSEKTVEKENKKRKQKSEVEDSVEEKYVGTRAKPGVTKMRKNFNLRTQAKLHFENLKNEKKRNKMKKPTLAEKRKQFIRQPKQKINQKKNENDNFSKLVKDYKTKLINAQSVQRTKWYES